MAVELSRQRADPPGVATGGDVAVKTVDVRVTKSHGVWHVTRANAFVGDYLKPEAALSAAVTLASEIEHAGGRAGVLFVDS